MYAYLFFHCNLAFSSIEEELRPDVIDRCYFPMLDLAAAHGIPIGVECTGWTLEQIAHLRPQWIELLRHLQCQNAVEFIGSGYTQLIGPLVPAEMNAVNQRLGVETYKCLLGMRPSVALINEQAYSAGVLEHYVNAGYDSILMEWENPALAHSEWNEDLRYSPQAVHDAQGRKLHLLWVQSVIFQQVQRVVHGDLDVQAFTDGLAKLNTEKARLICLYGNDAEVFDFRPGRFETEAALQQQEWKNMVEVFTLLRDKQDWEFCLPSTCLSLPLAQSGSILRLETAAQPVIVKKQPKYNLLRWAVTGRDDLECNTRCHQLLKAMQLSDATHEDWRTLCRLWSSDIRTHITDARWERFQREIVDMESRWQIAPSQCKASSALTEASACTNCSRWLDISTPYLRARLNTKKGLALEELYFSGAGDKPLVGTIPHGCFGDIAHAADYFTGHLVMEAPGERKLTDLALVAPSISETESSISVKVAIHNFYCPLEKSMEFSKVKPEIGIEYVFSWSSIPSSAIRLLHLTLLPNAFDNSSLYYATHNGGHQWERFLLNTPVNHTAPVSFLVSASHAVGMTEGLLRIGDCRNIVEVEVDKAQAALVGMVVHEPIGSQWLTRIILSYREFDDTAKAWPTSRQSKVFVRIRFIKQRDANALRRL